MSQIKLKYKKRQTGKTYDLIGKYLKLRAKNKNVVYVAYNRQSVENVRTRINNSSPFDDAVVTTFRECESVVDNARPTHVILDEFAFAPPGVIDSIITKSTKNDFKVLGYSSTKSE